MIGQIFNGDIFYNVFQVYFCNNFIEPSSWMSPNFASSLTGSIANTFAANLLLTNPSIFNINTNTISESMHKVMYYGDFILGDNNQFDDTNYYRVGDCCFATADIISYSNQPNYTNELNLNHMGYYNLFLSTIVRYSSKYQVNSQNLTYLITFANMEDTSSYLPSGTSSTFLNSPVFKYNDETQSGGSFVAKIEDILNGLRNINFNVPYSPILNTFTQDELDSYQITDAIHTLNRDFINATDSTHKILNYILSAIYSLDDKVAYIMDNLSTAPQSITNVTNNYFKPDYLSINKKKQELDDHFYEHLGFIYDIPSTLVYALTFVQDFDNDTPITITIPQLTIFDHTLMNEYTYSFTDLFNDNVTFNNFHNIILMCSDVIMFCLLLALGKKCYERVVDDK